MFSFVSGVMNLYWLMKYHFMRPLLVSTNGYITALREFYYSLTKGIFNLMSFKVLKIFLSPSN